MIVDSKGQLPFLNIRIPETLCESSFLNLSCFVQALRLFRLATELETQAARLRFEGLQHMTVAVTGVDCRELFTLLVTFFGQGMAFAEDPFAFLDGTPKSGLPSTSPIRMTQMMTIREEMKMPVPKFQRLPLPPPLGLRLFLQSRRSPK